MVFATTDGRTTFRVYLPHAGRVEVLGDFTDWRDHKAAMTRENPGWWTVSMEVPAGEHQFVYLVDGSIWLADYAAHGVKMSRDGGWVSRLVVQPHLHTTPTDHYAAA
ncbi:MAG: hypothetical protein ACREJO_08040 [Phycisphaerales bacterium]